ncbi:squalene/phytoene synthase family protein [Emticicia sp. CRIBPO]|uniref:phytoene/squalene synthase family protein n=1 Tax=Emticicia sp. CRIBPO TaxID=2683258 RepID=UPI001411DAA7|nr:phytoene/squalene synthase family protein [Emticicia sp. CRIBPO]NBA87246.1 squalene/phytoene synthase family protein [Emticicia sp. CRIBPO]
MFSLYEKTTFGCSKLITEQYSTSFTLGIKTLDRKFHDPVFAIYGFVRFADEIVDTFHDFDKKKLLERFKHDTYQAIEEGISLNPVLHSFQKVVRQYGIDLSLIESFLYSMEMDLNNTAYDPKEYNEYIFGSAEVVGLMCLKVFCEGDEKLYDQLQADARSLGAAFQKVNFLRDIQSDFVERGRVYFPGINFNDFSIDAKKAIEEDIQKDFNLAYRGITGLPAGAKRGVHLAYLYYLKLFKKIQNTSANKIQSTRIRVSDSVKFTLLARTLVMDSFRAIS